MMPRFASFLPRRAVLFAAAVLAGLATAGPLAQGADSVQRFAELVKPALSPGKIAWRSAHATGPRSLVLEDVALIPPPTAFGLLTAPMHIARVVISDIDFDGLARGDAPWRLDARLEGIVVRGSPALLPALGPGPYRTNAAIAYRISTGRELEIEHFSLDLLGLARLELSLDLGGLAAGGGKLRDASLETLSLRSGRAVYDDRSLLDKAVTAEARQQHVREDIVVAEWSALLGVIALKEGGEGFVLAKPLLAFLQDYRAPKGPLRLSFAAPPGRGLPLAAALNPGFVRTLGAKLSYAGAQ